LRVRRRMRFNPEAVEKAIAKRAAKSWEVAHARPA
jgi:hypothetical protein